MEHGPTRIVLAGGGTGGHVYPALAIAEIARRRLSDVDFLFIGVRGRAEERIVGRTSIPIAYVDVRGLSGRLASLPGFAAALARGCARARRILIQYDPHIVVGTGGFSSAPAVFAAMAVRRRGRPRIFLHEQNAEPGRMNRLAGRFADRIGTTFEASSTHFPAGRVMLTGYPVRPGISGRDRAEARLGLGIEPDAFVVLAFGGSGGARSLNRALVEALPSLLEDPVVHVVHATGMHPSDEYDPMADTRSRVEALGLEAARIARYHPSPYIDDMGAAYAASDIVVCRAGAGTLSELRAAGAPAVLVPKIGLPREHQLANARELEAAGCAWLLTEQVDPSRPGTMQLAGRDLAAKILELSAHRERLAEMRERISRQSVPDTERIIGDILDELAKQTSRRPI